MVYFVKHFKHYVYGRNFLLRTDHSSLVWLKNFKEPEGMVARWLATLETYNFDIHRQGALHGIADALSRKPQRSCNRVECAQGMAILDQDIRVIHDCAENINDQLTETNQQTDGYQVNVLCPSCLPPFDDKEFANAQLNDAVIKWIFDLKASQENKPEIKSLKQEGNILLKQWDLLKIKNGVLHRECIQGNTYFQLVTPKSLRTKIMEQLHNAWIEGHLGHYITESKTKVLLARHVRGCHAMISVLLAMSTSKARS